MNWILKKLLPAGIAVIALGAAGEAFARNQSEQTNPGEAVNRIEYVVGDVPITRMDIDQAMENLTRGRNKDQAVELLITRAIVDMEARKQSIIVSDERIENEIEKRMEVSGIQDMDRFQKMVESKTRQSFRFWKEELRYELKRRQLLQISVNVPMPEQNEIQEFYRKNKQRFGYEVSYREILFPSTGSISEEREISRKANNVYRRISLDPSSFSSVARNLRENISPMKNAGGLYTYQSIQEVASRSQILAGVIDRTSPGNVSRVFRDPATGRYMIVKVEGKRSISLERVEDLIRQRLYMEQEEEAFEDWIRQKKKETSIEKL